MTRDDVINRAYREIGRGEAPPQILTTLYSDYDLTKKDILERNFNNRPLWLFAYEIREVTEDMQTSDGSDLGFKYKYNLGADVIDVLGLNISLVNFASALGPRRAVDYGISIGVDQIATNLSGNSEFYYSDGVLHTDCETPSIVVKKDADESIWEASFTLLVAYSFAAFLAMSVARDPVLANVLQKKADMQFVVAARESTRQMANNSLGKWLQTYYLESSY